MPVAFCTSCKKPVRTESKAFPRLQSLPLELCGVELQGDAGNSRCPGVSLGILPRW